jgi:outer membrane biosynthesis protein TonB
VRFSTDSTIDGHRIIAATFPRMPVVDAVPKRDNPPPAFPEDEKADSVTSGEVVLRFVVDRSGTPDLATIELVRATSLSFAKAAVIALPSQRFEPATIRGCAVAQVIDYSFSFVVRNH